MLENKDYYLHSKNKFYLLPFVIIMCLIQIPAILLRFRSDYPNISAVLYIVFTLFLSMLTIIGYLLFLAHISKKRKPIEVSNGYVFCGADKLHVSEIQSVNLLSNSGIEIISAAQTLESFHITNNREIMDAIFKQKKVFTHEA